MTIINFYSTKTEYGCFSNFSKHPVTIDGTTWPTSEHYYQAQKFEDHTLKEQVRHCKGPKQAALMGRDRSLPMRKDWDDIKEDVMYRVLLAKFSQNLDAKATLINSIDAELVEDSPRDYYWGCGSNGSGKNRLGKLLMQVRDELRNANAV